MGQTKLPFKPAKQNHAHGADLFNCPLYRMLPKPLRRECKKQVHLMEYLHLLPVEKIGVPQYVEILTRDLKDLKDPNLIYPVPGGLFVHIYPNPKDVRDYYIAIQPGMAQDLDQLMEEVEYRLVDFVAEMEKAPSPEERRELMLRLLDRVVTVRGRGGKDVRGGQTRNSLFARLLRGGRHRSKLPMTRSQYQGIRYLIVRDKEGVGPLQPLVQDPYIEDISCSGVGNLFVEHKIFGSLKADISFASFEELDRFVVRISEKIGRPVTFREPIVDATLPDGSRINIVFGADVSKRGSNFSIRKVSEKPLSILDLVSFKSLSYEIIAYLSLILQDGMNVFFSGETASGKTTLMNALTTFISPDAKIVSIEDTAELQVPHPNWTREVIRGLGKQSDAGAVSMFDLLKAALRQRPNEIIIGEIRGEEGAIAFQAMQTGHACMATFHASSVEKLIQRMTGHPINVPKTYIDNLNVVVIQSAVRLPDGKMGRRVVSVNEIVGYDSSSDSFSFIEVFRWDPVKDFFEFVGYMNTHLLEERVAPRRGIPPGKKRQIYHELERRARILEKIHSEGVTDFHDLYSVISKAYREGHLR